MTKQERQRRKDDRDLARQLAWHSRTFDELWAEYLRFFSVEDGPDGDQIRDVGRKVAAYHGVTLEESVLAEVLLSTAQNFDPTRGSFLRLLRRNLHQRVLRDAKRAAGRPDSKALRVDDYAEVLAAKEEDEAEEAHRRWRKHLLRVALLHVDPQTRAYVVMEQDGVPVTEIARRLGVTAKTLWNKYGAAERDDYRRVGRRLREALDRAVASLPGHHFRALVRHLLVEAGHRPDAVGQLLGVSVGTIDYRSAPLLEEGDLLDVLGLTQMFEENGKSEFETSQGRDSEGGRRSTTYSGANGGRTTAAARP